MLTPHDDYHLISSYVPPAGEAVYFSGGMTHRCHRFSRSVLSQTYSSSGKIYSTLLLGKFLCGGASQPRAGKLLEVDASFGRDSATGIDVIFSPWRWFGRHGVRRNNRRRRPIPASSLRRDRRTSLDTISGSAASDVMALVAHSHDASALDIVVIRPVGSDGEISGEAIVDDARSRRAISEMPLRPAPSPNLQAISSRDAGG